MERQKAAIDLCVTLGMRHCRTLSGQRFPGMTRREGVERTVEGIRRSLDYAEKRGVAAHIFESAEEAQSDWRNIEGPHPNQGERANHAKAS